MPISDNRLDTHTCGHASAGPPLHERSRREGQSHRAISAPIMGRCRPGFSAGSDLQNNKSHWSKVSLRASGATFGLESLGHPIGRRNHYRDFKADRCRRSRRHNCESWPTKGHERATEPIRGNQAGVGALEVISPVYFASGNDDGRAPPNRFFGFRIGLDEPQR